MKVFVLYDSLYGNTQKIAEAIGQAFIGEAKVSKVTQINLSEVEGVGLLIVGSPTHGGRPTPAVQDFLKNIPGSSIQGTSFAAFDTRSSILIARVFGYASPRIAATLKEKGGMMISPPEAFFVVGSKGPLKDGELERALNWGKKLKEILEKK